MTEAPQASAAVAAWARFAVRLMTPFVLGLLLALAGCAPTDPNGSIEGLIAPPSVSVVTADPDLVAASLHTLGVSQFPADAEYFTDGVHQFVYDGALKQIEKVNEVLCLLAQSRYEALTNDGLYLAQIDPGLCATGGGPLNQAGGGRQLEEWIVRSLRPTIQDPQRVEFWVPTQEEGGGLLPPTTLFSRLDVFAAPTASNPFGAFHMNFAGTAQNGNPKDAQYCGLIATRPPVVGRFGYDLFFLRGDLGQLPLVGDHHELTQVRVDLAVDQSSGFAAISRLERRNDPFNGDSGVVPKLVRLAFDATTLVRQEDQGPVVALQRDAFGSCSLRYNLYVDDARLGTLGERVRLRTGVPIRLESGSQAFLDYYGLHRPNGEIVVDGEFAQEELPGGGLDPKPLELRVAPGRLIELTRNTTPISTLAGTIFEWDEPWTPQSNGPVTYRLVCDGVDFIAVEIFDPVAGAFTPISPFAVPLDAWFVLRLRSKRFGGNCAVRLGSPDLSWYTERVVSGDDSLFKAQSTLNLYALLDALRPGITALEAEAGDVFFPPANNPGSPYTYVFDRADRTLRTLDTFQQLSPVGLANGEIPASGPFVKGMRSGPLVVDTTSLQTNEEIFDAATYYVWETGANEWNWWFGLTDSTGATLVLDAPLQFPYTHSTANDANGDSTYDGVQFLLEYRGDGQLFGIPYQPVDTDIDGQPDHDAPIFSLADGVALGPLGSGYVVKTIERELLLLPAGSIPPGLDPAQADALTLPDGSFYRTPDIGPVPPLVEAPTVVGGELLRLRPRN